MATIIIDEKTKVGKNLLEMLKALARIENEGSIRFLDETEYLLSTKANSETLLHGVNQVKKGIKGTTMKIDELWK